MHGSAVLIEYPECGLKMEITKSYMSTAEVNLSYQQEDKNDCHGRNTRMQIDQKNKHPINNIAKGKMKRNTNENNTLVDVLPSKYKDDLHKVRLRPANACN